MVIFKPETRNPKSEIRRSIQFVVCLVLIFLFSIPNHLIAQEVRAEAKVDSNHITIGDWLRLTVEVQHPSNVTVFAPALPDSFESFELVKRESPVVKGGDLSTLESSSFTITSFDSGLRIIPPISIPFSVAGDTSKHFAQTYPIPITVRGIAIDTTQEIKDVKPPLSVPITFADLLPYLIALVVIAGLVWLFLFIRKKRRLGESILPQAPPRPAHEVALEALRALESEKLWQRGKVKDYHSELTDIVRTYIEHRFGVMAMEMVSYEILMSDVIRSVPKESFEKLNEILLRADLVKFAKFQPTSEENESSLPLAVSFVESTWRQPAEKNIEESITAEVKSS